MEEQAKNILVYGISNNRGGVENFLLSLQSQLSTKYRFVFLLDQCECIYKKEIENSGGIIEYFDHKKDKADRNSIYKILKKYSSTTQILYLNISDLKHENVWLVFLAKMLGYKIVAHSHGAMLSPISSTIHRFFHFVIEKIGRKLLSDKSVTRLAVSSRAGKYIYGELSFQTISAGIDTEKFRFNLLKRDKIRETLGIDDFYVIGFIGRLVDIKNPFFAINVLSGLLERDQKVFLLMVGDGPLRGDIEAFIGEKNIENNIKITGMINNVNDYLQAIDCVIGTSFSEGFPLAFIEAQVSGAKCICAKENYPAELAKTTLLSFIPISGGCKAWVESIILDIKKKDVLLQQRKDMHEDVQFFDETFLANEMDMIFRLCKDR